MKKAWVRNEFPYRSHGLSQESPQGVQKAFQQGRTSEKAEAYSWLYVEPLSDVRTKLEDFFNILLVGHGRISQVVRRLHGLGRPDENFSVEGGDDQMFTVARPMEMIWSFDMERLSFHSCR